MNTMTTYSGRKFDPMQMTPGDVYIEDIAHALSLLCRGGGQLSYFYSVGQHSLNCAAEAKARGWSERQQLACLLHDASEGYISDIIRPVKIYLSNYLEIESKIMGTILTHFGLDDLTEEESCRWKQIDDEILELELKTLLHGEENREVPKLLSVPDLAGGHPPGLCGGGGPDPVRQHLRRQPGEARPHRPHRGGGGPSLSGDRPPGGQGEGLSGPGRGAHRPAAGAHWHPPL